MKAIALSLKAEGIFIVNSDNSTCGGDALSTQAGNDSTYACGRGECSDSSEIRGRQEPCEITGEPKSDQPGSAGTSKPKRTSRSKELLVKALLTAKLMRFKRIGKAR